MHACASVLCMFAYMVKCQSSAKLNEVACMQTYVLAIPMLHIHNSDLAVLSDL